MKRFLWTACKDEDGAVTVDWVVMCAAMVALAILTVNGIRTYAVTASDDAMWMVDD